MRIRRLTYAVILSGAALWCALILLAPLVRYSPGFAPLSGVLYAFFSPLCHQIDARSFHLAGNPLAVCARCSAIYFGFLLGTIIYPVGGNFLPPSRTGRMFLVLTAVPMLIDVVLESAGVYDSSNLIRALTGSWFGILLPFLIIPGAAEGTSQLYAQHNSHAVPSEKGLIDA